jgi:hypothetical protein
MGPLGWQRGHGQGGLGGLTGLFIIYFSKAVYSSAEKGEKCTVARFGFIW